MKLEDYRTLLDNNDFVAAFDAMNKLNWGRHQGTYNNLRDNYLDLPIAENLTGLRSKLKTLLGAYFQESFGLPLASPHQHAEKVSLPDGVSYKYSLPGEFFLVNCNRTDEYLNMIDHLTKDEGHQFYFILSCPSQDPLSLVQRLVLQICKELDDDEDKIIFKKINNNSGNQRIGINVVEPDNRMEQLARIFLSQLENGQQSLANFLDALPNRQEKYIASAFEFFSNDWRAPRFESLMQQWLQMFSTKTAGPRCLFFFIINFHGLHCKEILTQRENELINAIKILSNQFGNQSLLIDRLPQVEVGDIYTWLGKMFKGKPESLFESWCKKNDMPTGLMHEDRLDMADASTFMQEIWHYGHQTQKSFRP